MHKNEEPATQPRTESEHNNESFKPYTARQKTKSVGFPSCKERLEFLQEPLHAAHGGVRREAGPLPTKFFCCTTRSWRRLLCSMASTRPYATAKRLQDSKNPSWSPAPTKKRVSATELKRSIEDNGQKLLLDTTWASVL